MAQRDKRVIWSPKSKQDLHDIWRYFEAVATRDVADRLVRDIALAADRLQQHPLMGRPREEVFRAVRSVRVHPYSILYRIIDDRVEIARVLHERRDLPTAFADKGSD